MSLEDLKLLRFEYVEPASLDENPNNWRLHPELQKDAIGGLLDEVGWAGALLYNEATNRLIDGHARKEIALQKGIPIVPVLIGHWTPAQEAKILLTLDPLTKLAEINQAAINALLRDVETGDQALATLITQLAEEAKVIPADKPAAGQSGQGDASGDDKAEGDEAGSGANCKVYSFRVDCTTETRRDELMSSLSAEGVCVVPIL